MSDSNRNLETRIDQAIEKVFAQPGPGLSTGFTRNVLSSIRAGRGEMKSREGMLAAIFSFTCGIGMLAILMFYTDPALLSGTSWQPLTNLLADVAGWMKNVQFFLQALLVAGVVVVLDKWRAGTQHQAAVH